MKISIVKRVLYQKEIDILVDELHTYPHIGWISASGWKKFGPVFVTTSQGAFVGVCVPVFLSHWVKLGPLVISEKFQGKGYGKQLLGHAIHALRKYDLYIGSSNPLVGRIALQSGFERGQNFFNLPYEIRRYLVSYFIERLNPVFILDAVKKIFVAKRRKYFYYIKRE